MLHYLFACKGVGSAVLSAQQPVECATTVFRLTLWPDGQLLRVCRECHSSSAYNFFGRVASARRCTCSMEHLWLQLWLDDAGRVLPYRMWLLPDFLHFVSTCKCVDPREQQLLVATHGCWLPWWADGHRFRVGRVCHEQDTLRDAAGWHMQSDCM